MTQPPDIQSVDQVRYGRWRRFRNSTVALAEREEMAEEFERVIDLGYLDGTSPAPETSGVTIYDEERACKGWNFYTSGHAAEAHLMNMEGEVVHTWAYQYEDVWPARIPSWERGTHHWRRGHLFDNGDLLAIFDGNGLIKLGRDSNLIWAFAGQCHHDLDVAADGRIYVLTREHQEGHWLRPEGSILHDLVTVLDANGNELERVSLLKCFENSVYAPMLAELPGRIEPSSGDTFHSNTIEVLKGSLGPDWKRFRQGNVLVSMRRLDAIAVVDLDQEKVVWAMTGMWRKQHQPTVLENGRMLIFDNLGHSNWSRVIEFDPFTQQIYWCYAGDPPSDFLSFSCGSNQRLSNGNTLITESDNGRAFEVTPDKVIVWEFVNPHRAGEQDELIATLFELVRLDRAFPVGWVDGKANG